ncbi:MAG: mercury(II) reductase [Candidatus Bathyarchaeia archaeon]
MRSEYDVVIIGRGAAAFASMIRASELSEHQASILMAGTGPVGGTCVNVGCVPSKYLLEASHANFYPRNPKFAGVGATHPDSSFEKVMEGVRDLVSGFRNEKYEKVLHSYPNVELIEGKARFKSANEVEILDSSKAVVRGKNIIIATGSRPTAPPIQGLNDTGFITSDTVWNLNEQPRSIAIIGGGAIGLELGQAFLHFDSEVTIIEALPIIMATAEPEISEKLQHKLEGEGMKFYVKARINSVGKKDGRKFLEVVTAQGKTVVECDEILVATGRAPNTDGLLLENANVRTDKRGSIETDAGMKTSNPRVYAAGDCVSKKLMLETLSAREGVVAASNIMGQSEVMDYLSIPWAVFTNPQIAAVGKTEEEFVKETGSCSCRVVELGDVAKAAMLGEKEGLLKLVIDPRNGKVVGLHVLSPLATEFIIEGVYAIKNGATFRDIINTTHIFPTLAEGVKLAAQSFTRDIGMMSCCVE